MKIKALPSQSRLREVLNYCPDSGTFIWKVQVAARCPPGTLAGTDNKARGYRTISVDRTIYAAHRLAWRYITGDDPAEKQIDHVNGDRGDNRFCNLRLASRQQNMRNVRLPVTNKTGFKGVSWDKKLKKYRACIRVNNKTMNLGSFVSPEVAHQRYIEAAKEHYGEFFRSC